MIEIIALPLLDDPDQWMYQCSDCKHASESGPYTHIEKMAALHAAVYHAETS